MLAGWAWLTQHLHMENHNFLFFDTSSCCVDAISSLISSRLPHAAVHLATICGSLTLLTYHSLYERQQMHATPSNPSDTLASREPAIPSIPWVLGSDCQHAGRSICCSCPLSVSRLPPQRSAPLTLAPSARGGAIPSALTGRVILASLRHSFGSSAVLLAHASSKVIRRCE